MKIAAIFLIIVGVVCLLLGASWDTTPSGYVNFHAVSQQQTLLMIGGFTFLGGLVTLGFERMRPKSYQSSESTVQPNGHAKGDSDQPQLRPTEQLPERGASLNCSQIEKTLSPDYRLQASGNIRKGLGVTENLMPDEEVVQRGTLHGFIFVFPIGLIVLGLLTLSGQFETANSFSGVIVLLVGIGSLVAVFRYWTSTQLTVTNKHVIAKTLPNFLPGQDLIRHKTIELDHSKVESLKVDQSFFGRMFDFGTVTICDTRGGATPVLYISRPLHFRQEAMRVIENRGGFEQIPREDTRKAWNGEGHIRGTPINLAFAVVAFAIVAAMAFLVSSPSRKEREASLAQPNVGPTVRDFGEEREKERTQAENRAALVDWFNQNYSIEVHNLYLVERSSRVYGNLFGFIGEIVISCASVVRCEQLRGYTASLYIDVLAGSENVKLTLSSDGNQGAIEETSWKGCFRNELKHKKEAEESALAIDAFLEERGLTLEKPDTRWCRYLPPTEIKGIYRLNEDYMNVVFVIHPFFRADELRGELSEILDSANTSSGGHDLRSMREGTPQELTLRVRFNRGDIPVSFIWTDRKLPALVDR